MHKGDASPVSRIRDCWPNVETKRASENPGQQETDPATSMKCNF